MRNILSSLAFFVLSVVGAPAWAHEFWIDPVAFQVQIGTPVEADLRNGQKFSGLALPYYGDRVARHQMLFGGELRDLTGRDGDRPAIQLKAEDGLMVLVYQSTPSTIRYEDWAVFDRFVAHKGFGDIAAQHEARGLPQVDFKESYTRYCKALIGGGSGAGADALVGLETEFVAGVNPYVDDISGGMVAHLYYQGAPRGNAQVEVYERSVAGDVVVSVVHTDDAGRLVFPLKPGFSYMMDAVVLREPAAAAAGEVWESLWASMTFAVPQ